ncbi:MAG: hypothetical protein QW566_02475 [Candidatus Jordarchaeales archaeon]
MQSEALEVEKGRCERIGFTKHEVFGEILAIVSRLIKHELENFGINVWTESYVHGRNGVITVKILTDDGEDEKDGET